MNLKKWVIFLSLSLVISCLFLVCFVILTIHFSDKASEANLNISSKASIFDSKFHDLMQEHTFLLINTVRRSLDSSDSFNASYNALQINLDEIAAQLAVIYGPDNANQFLSIENEKIDSFISYTNNMKSNNFSANAIFLINISEYEQNASNFWSNTSTSVVNINKSQMMYIISEQDKDVKSAVDLWGARDYVDYFARLHDAYTQMGIYSDTIAQDIVKQHPEIFQ